MKAKPAPERSPMLMRGPSMWPTLRSGDLLEVVAVNGRRPVRVGDVVCRAGDGVDVVHRVVARRVTADGRELLHTRGDSNPLVDREPVYVDALHGAVTGAWRDGRRIRVWGGAAGMLVHLRVRLTRGPLLPLRQLVRRAYLAAARGGGLGRLLPAAVAPRVVRTGAGSAETLRVLLGGRVVGHFARGEHRSGLDEARRGVASRRVESRQAGYRKGREGPPGGLPGRWVIRPPYRLLIDERRLPQPGRAQQQPSRAEPLPGDSGPRPNGAEPRRDVAKPQPGDC